MTLFWPLAFPMAFFPCFGRFAMKFPIFVAFHHSGAPSPLRKTLGAVKRDKGQMETEVCFIRSLDLCDVFCMDACLRVRNK